MPTVHCTASKWSKTSKRFNGPNFNYKCTNISMITWRYGGKYTWNGKVSRETGDGQRTPLSLGVVGATQLHHTTGTKLYW